MRIVLIDDNTAVRDNLKVLIDLYAPGHEIVGEADGVQKGLACLKGLQLDLLLLDVEMQDGTGFDLMAMYGVPNFKVIFVTAHDAYAIKAFKYNALDYLLKPVDPDELVKAITKAQSKMDESHTLKPLPHKIILKDADAVYLVAVNDIVRCQASANYTLFFLNDGRKLTISKTLKSYDTLLKGHAFFRAHQSHLINLKHFDRYEKRDGGTLYMKDGSTLPVAIRKKEALMEALEALN